MKKFKKSYLVIYIFVAIATLLFSFFTYQKAPQFSAPQDFSSFEYEFIHGEITQMPPNFDPLQESTLRVRANSGLETDSTISVTLNPLNNYNVYSPGDEVLIYKSINRETGETNYEITDFYHQNGLAYIFLIFSIIAIIVARGKGVTAIVSVLLSLTLFYFVLLKMISVGYSPLTSALVFTLIVTGLTIPLIHGFNKKSLAALIAIIIGYGASIIVTYVFRDLAQIGSAPGEEFRTFALLYPQISISDILIASLFLGAIGALIDTAISIASAVFEAIEETKASFKKVFKIGMEVGKDILGSMTNTLLFAYLASSLPFFILLTFSQTGRENALSELINMDFIALELTRTFVGAVSLVILIPIVATLSAYFLVKFKKV